MLILVHLNFFLQVTYLEPGQSIDVEVKDRGMVNVCATAGPILGPPWQRPENGQVDYILG